MPVNLRGQTGVRSQERGAERLVRAQESVVGRPTRMRAKLVQ